MDKNDEWRTGRHCVFKNFVHLVFVPKYRKKVFSKAMLDRLSELFTETCLQMDCELLEFNGEIDHVHWSAFTQNTPFQTLSASSKENPHTSSGRSLLPSSPKNFGATIFGHILIAQSRAVEPHLRL